jgi:hypothetical protein
MRCVLPVVVVVVVVVAIEAVDVSGLRLVAGSATVPEVTKRKANLKKRTVLDWVWQSQPSRC